MKIPSVVRWGIASCAAALVVSSLAWSTGSVAATPSPLSSPPRLALQPLNGLPAVPTDVAHHKQELVAFKTGVLDMDPAAVASSTQVVGGGEVVVRRPAVDFHVGQVVTAPVTPTLTSGVAGRVTKVTSVGGSTRLVLAPVRPDEVYFCKSLTALRSAGNRSSSTSSGRLNSSRDAAPAVSHNVPPRWTHAFNFSAAARVRFGPVR